MSARPDPMRILLVVDCYLPSTKSCAKLIHDLAVELSRQGHDVVLLAPIDEAAEPMTVTVEEGFTLVRVPTGAIKGMPLPLRALRELAMPHMLWHATEAFLTSRRIDLVVYYSPSIFFAPLVRRVKRFWRCPAYLVLRDIFPKWARDCGVLRDGLVYRFFQREAIRQYDQADIIGVESEGNVRYFEQEFPGKGYKVEVLNNWTALDEGTLPKANHRQRLGLEDKVVFFYGGNMGVAQGMEGILHLIRAMRSDDRVRFLLVGEGCEVPRIRDAVAKEGLGNVILLPPVEPRAYLSMLSEADVGVVSLARNLTTHNVPGKALPYMYWSLPILASLNPGNDLVGVLGATQAGFAVETGDLDGLAAAARRLASDADLRARMGANARRLLEERFSAAAAARQITQHWQ
jgi:glycosyltransferase involved in cell wall biosynthesis